MGKVEGWLSSEVGKVGEVMRWKGGKGKKVREGNKVARWERWEGSEVARWGRWESGEVGDFWFRSRVGNAE